mmetsp:Transcript_80242/g.215022  ORF Transcript_80242/g.215022 Transcript_80242/m.215022 type:complete len:155 (+) Transcript_80242:46-510(+)
MSLKFVLSSVSQSALRAFPGSVGLSQKAVPWLRSDRNIFERCLSAPAAAASDGVKPRAPRAPRPRKAVLTVSERAAARVAELIAKKDPKPLGLRLGVRTRGCNGLSYTMNYVDAAPKNDEVIDADGVKIFVDPKAVMYLLGSRMDFVVSPLCVY